MQQVIKTLETAIRYHKDCYYNNQPEITDAEYDQLEEELRQIDPDNEILHKVGSESSENITKHSIWMPSIQKFKDIDAMKKWIGDSDVTYSFKLDGSSMELVCRDGSVVRSSTRGDGYVGEDRTESMQFVSGIPSTNITGCHDAIIWGEVLITKENFEFLCAEKIRRGGEPYKSIRNAVAGVLNGKTDKDLCRYLNFVAHNIFSEDTAKKTHREKLYYLHGSGFEVPVFDSFGHFDAFADHYTSTRDDYQYLTDGIVATRNLPGYDLNDKTSHHFRWNAAYKFSSDEAKTIVSNITWQIGRTGKLTPVLEVEPTELSDCTISRVTAHNAKYIVDMGIVSGREITITRSNEVIPKVVGVTVPAPNACDSLPTVCPSCCRDLVWSDSKTDLFCNYHSCPEQKILSFVHFAKTMDMENVSDAMIRLFATHNLIRFSEDCEFLSLYDITTNDLMRLPRFGVKQAERIVSSISDSINKFTEEKFIAALGISGIGRDVSKKLVAVGIDNVAENPTIMETIPGIGEVLFATIEDNIDYIQYEIARVKEKLKHLLPQLPTGEATKEAVSGGVFAGQSFILSGSFSEVKRHLEQLITVNGGIIAGSVNKDLDYLVTNEVGTSKYLKAQKLGKKIISEEELRALLK
jgi:DNA ligase (NAD+)